VCTVALILRHVRERRVFVLAELRKLGYTLATSCLARDAAYGNLELRLILRNVIGTLLR